MSNNMRDVLMIAAFLAFMTLTLVFGSPGKGKGAATVPRPAISSVVTTPLGAEAKAAWSTHRQALRDLPQTYADPDQVVWPEPPR